MVAAMFCIIRQHTSLAPPLNTSIEDFHAIGLILILFQTSKKLFDFQFFCDHRKPAGSGKSKEEGKLLKTYKLVMTDTFGALWHHYTSIFISLMRKRLIRHYLLHKGYFKEM